MRKKDYGIKYTCYQCGCRFYDLKKSRPLCPKCGVDQSEARQKGSGSSTSRQGTTPGSSRARMRKKKDDDGWSEGGNAMDLEDEGKGEALEDGLSLVEDDDDEFSGLDDDDGSDLD